MAFSLGGTSFSFDSTGTVMTVDWDTNGFGSDIDFFNGTALIAVTGPHGTAIFVWDGVGDGTAGPHTFVTTNLSQDGVTYGVFDGQSVTVTIAAGTISTTFTLQSNQQLITTITANNGPTPVTPSITSITVNGDGTEALLNFTAPTDRIIDGSAIITEPISGDSASCQILNDDGQSSIRVDTSNFPLFTGVEYNITITAGYFRTTGQPFESPAFDIDFTVSAGQGAISGPPSITAASFSSNGSQIALVFNASVDSVATGNVTVTGGGRTTRFSVTSGDNGNILTFNKNPSDQSVQAFTTVSAVIPAGLFRVANQPSGDTNELTTLNNFNSGAGGENVAAPVFVDYTFANNGNRVTVFWDKPVTVWNTVSLTVNSQERPVSGTYQYVLGTGGTAIRYELASGFPFFDDELVSLQVPANIVSAAGQSASAPRNLGTTFNKRVGGGGIDRTVPVASAIISSNGTTLTLTWNTNVDYNAGDISLSADFTPSGDTTLNIPDSTPDAQTFIYTLSTAIKEGDTVVLDIPAGFVNAQDALSTQSETQQLLVDNQSTDRFSAPTLSSSVVDTTGANLVLTFSASVTLGTGVNWSNAIKLIARDISGQVSRVLSGSTPSGSGTTEITIPLTGGVVFGNELGGPGDPDDGDELAFHTNGFTNLFIDSQSLNLVPVAAAALGNPADPFSGVTPTNNSTVVEAAPPDPPVVASVEVKQFSSPFRQELEIIFEPASPGAFSMNYISGVPTLTSTLSGPIPLTFNRLTFAEGELRAIIFDIGSPPVASDDESESLTLQIPANLIRDSVSSVANAAETINNADITNNSSYIPPAVEPSKPILQDIIVGLDGDTLGLYYDINVGASPVINSISLITTFGGELTADFTTESVPAQANLLAFRINERRVVFKNERIFVTVPAGVASANGETSDKVESFEANNQSRVPVLTSPIILTAVADATGTVITITFNKDIETGTLEGAYLETSATGRKGLDYTRIDNGNQLVLDIDGVIYGPEVTTLYLPKNYIRESEYGVTGNENIVQDVDISAVTTSGTPDVGFDE